MGMKDESLIVRFRILPHREAYIVRRIVHVLMVAATKPANMKAMRNLNSPFQNIIVISNWQIWMLFLFMQAGMTLPFSPISVSGKQVFESTAPRAIAYIIQTRCFLHIENVLQTVR